jgi:hypothetical protein
VNERIQKLAEQAGFIDFIVFNRIESKEQVIEKFAQLIVLECANIAEESDTSWSGAGPEAASQIKSHFGVEE